MKVQEIKELVYANFDKGFHCAESIANAVYQMFPNKAVDCTHFASGFCGGVGKCKQDICGGLSGAIIALGGIWGRTQGGENIDQLVTITTKARTCFIQNFKSTKCCDVIENIKDVNGLENCRDMVAKFACELYFILENELKK